MFRILYLEFDSFIRNERINDSDISMEPFILRTNKIETIDDDELYPQWNMIDRHIRQTEI